MTQELDKSRAIHQKVIAPSAAKPTIHSVSSRTLISATCETRLSGVRRYLIFYRQFKQWRRAHVLVARNFHCLLTAICGAGRLISRRNNSALRNFSAQIRGVAQVTKHVCPWMRARRGSPAARRQDCFRSPLLFSGFAQTVSRAR
jgi:hypothetical protein